MLPNCIPYPFYQNHIFWTCARDLSWPWPPTLGDFTLDRCIQLVKFCSALHITQPSPRQRRGWLQEPRDLAVAAAETALWLERGQHAFIAYAIIVQRKLAKRDHRQRHARQRYEARSTNMIGAEI